MEELGIRNVLLHGSVLVLPCIHTKGEWTGPVNNEPHTAEAHTFLLLPCFKLGFAYMAHNVSPLMQAEGHVVRGGGHGFAE